MLKMQFRGIKTGTLIPYSGNQIRFHLLFTFIQMDDVIVLCHEGGKLCNPINYETLKSFNLSKNNCLCIISFTKYATTCDIYWGDLVYPIPGSNFKESLNT